MLCAGCEDILDCRRAVEVTVLGAAGGSPRVYCGDCWARAALEITRRRGSAMWVRHLEIVDGYAMPHPDVDEPATRAPGWWMPTLVPDDCREDLWLAHGGPG